MPRQSAGRSSTSSLNANCPRENLESDPIIEIINLSLLSPATFHIPLFGLSVYVKFEY